MGLNLGPSLPLCKKEKYKGRLSDNGGSQVPLEYSHPPLDDDGLYLSTLSTLSVLRFWQDNPRISLLSRLIIIRFFDRLPIPDERESSFPTLSDQISPKKQLTEFSQNSRLIAATDRLAVLARLDLRTVRSVHTVLCLLLLYGMAAALVSGYALPQDGLLGSYCLGGNSGGFFHSNLHCSTMRILLHPYNSIQ